MVPNIYDEEKQSLEKCQGGKRQSLRTEIKTEKVKKNMFH